MLKELERSLANTLAAFKISQTQFGKPHLVEKAKNEAERLFQNVAKAVPSQRSAYQAALKYIRGQLHPSDESDAFEFDMLAAAICEPLQEQGGLKVLGAGDRFSGLLKFYELQAKQGNLWRVTWYALLSAYFSFDSSRASEAEKIGWEQLRSFLERTWQFFSNPEGIAPDWVTTLRSNSIVLSKTPCTPYATDVLTGNDSKVKALGEKLGIPPSSWFWHHLVLDVTKAATSLSDDDFRKAIPRLIELLIERPVYRDESINLMLVRYHKCANRTANEHLRDYVIDKSVWKNPKLKFAGIATSWNQVPEDVWRMVLGWVTESNLRLFFQLLDGRNASDSGRFAFWSKYLNQIGYTKLIFGDYTRYQAKSNRELATLLSQEEGISASLVSNDHQADAFLMEIGNLIIVEFSKQPNAAYLYPKNAVPFDMHAKLLSDGTEPKGLKAGYHNNVERITHVPNWEDGARHKLAAHGIYPDKQTSNKSPSWTTNNSPTFTAYSPSSHSTSISAKAPSGAPYTMRQLQDAVALGRATIEDSRPGGRLWVNHNQQYSTLGKQLQAWGFRWADKREAWYYPE